jgi:hypothetical protein
MSEIQKPSGLPSPPSTPRWVIVFVVILILLVAIVVIVHLLGVRFDHGTGSILFNILASLIEQAT